MGILTGVGLFVLLSVNLVEATTIAPENLKYIVDQFHLAVPQGEKLKQFAFLMVLNKDQCSKKLTNFKPTVPQKTPQNNLDYIAFRPGPMKDLTGTKENVCSETHILYPPKKNAQSPAQTFGHMQTAEETFKDGGCVIFYTTNTPCTRRCFNVFEETEGGKKCFEIGGPLIRVPFDNWHNNPNIDMYFVYTNRYMPKKDDFKNEDDYEKFQQDTTNGFRRLDENNFYIITRCDNNGCQECNSKSNFCLGTWPAWSELQ